jgi:hypothetical protein
MRLISTRSMPDPTIMLSMNLSSGAGSECGTREAGGRCVKDRHPPFDSGTAIKPCSLHPIMRA